MKRVESQNLNGWLRSTKYTVSSFYFTVLGSWSSSPVQLTGRLFSRCCDFGNSSLIFEKLCFSKSVRASKKSWGNTGTEFIWHAQLCKALFHEGFLGSRKWGLSGGVAKFLMTQLQNKRNTPFCNSSTANVITTFETPKSQETVQIFPWSSGEKSKGCLMYAPSKRKTPPTTFSKMSSKLASIVTRT